MEQLNTGDIGEFTWLFGKEYFVVTAKGNYLWSDPEYGGDNTMIIFSGNYEEVCRYNGVPYGRNKGKHRICDYCPGVTILPSPNG